MVCILGTGHRHYIHHSVEFRPFNVFPTVLMFQNHNCLIFRSFACLHHLLPCASPYTVSAQMQDSLHSAKDNTMQKKTKKGCDTGSSHARSFTNTASSFNYESLPSGKACGNGVSTRCLRPRQHFISSLCPSHVSLSSKLELETLPVLPAKPL